MSFSNKVIDGGDIVLKVNGQILLCGTSHTLELTNAVREIACKGSGDFNTSEYGRFSWTVSADALFNLDENSTQIKYPDLLALMLNKTVVSIESYYEEGSDTFIMAGQAIITSVSQSAPDSDNTTFSISLQGKGELGISGNNLFEISVDVGSGTAETILVEELGEIRVNPSLPTKFNAVAGTYHVVGYNADGTASDRKSVVVSNSDVSVSLDIA